MLQQPSSMDELVIFARAFEQCLVSRDAGPQQLAHGQHRGDGRTPPQIGLSAPTAPVVPSVTAGTMPSSSVKCLTSAEIAERWKDDRCFHCDEFFMNGHKLGASNCSPSSSSTRPIRRARATPLTQRSLSHRDHTALRPNDDGHGSHQCGGAHGPPRLWLHAQLHRHGRGMSR
jgi:hypothetical protein